MLKNIRLCSRLNYYLSWSRNYSLLNPGWQSSWKHAGLVKLEHFNDHQVSTWSSSIHVIIRYLCDHQVSTWSSGIHVIIRYPRDHQLPTWSSGIHLIIRYLRDHQVPTWSSATHVIIRYPLDHQVSTWSSGTHVIISYPRNHQVFTWSSDIHVIIRSFSFPSFTLHGLKTCPVKVKCHYTLDFRENLFSSPVVSFPSFRRLVGNRGFYWTKSLVTQFFN